MDSQKSLWKTYKWIWLMFGLVGIFVGLGCYTLYASRSWSYLSDDSKACLNCHVMGSYYQSWAKSSHFVWTNCNDCHVPQDKFLRKWAFKATDGLYHAYAFTMGLDKEIIRAREGTYQVLQENCLRCHSPLVTEFTKMSPDYASVTTGEKKACWDCHRDTPHTTVSSTTSINYGGLPIPASPAPDWLEAMIGDKPQ